MLPDPIELMEFAIDRHCDDVLDVDGNYRCQECRKVVDLDDLVLASPNPHSPAVCPACAGLEQIK